MKILVVSVVCLNGKSFRSFFPGRIQGNTELQLTIRAYTVLIKDNVSPYDFL